MTEFSEDQYTPSWLKFQTQIAQEFWKPPFKQNSENQKAFFGHFLIEPQECLLSVRPSSLCFCNQKLGFSSSTPYADSSFTRTVSEKFFRQKAHSLVSPYSESSVGRKQSELKSDKSPDTTYPNPVCEYEVTSSVNYTFIDDAPLDLSVKTCHVAVDTNEIKKLNLEQTNHDVKSPNLSTSSLSRVQVLEATTTHYDSSANEHCNKNKSVLVSDNAKIEALDKVVSTTEVLKALKQVRNDGALDLTSVIRRESVTQLSAHPLICEDGDEHLYLSSSDSANCTDHFVSQAGELNLEDAIGSDTDKTAILSSVARNGTSVTDLPFIRTESSGTNGHPVLSNAPEEIRKLSLGGGVRGNSHGTGNLPYVAFKDEPLVQHENCNTRSDQPIYVSSMVSGKPRKLGALHSPDGIRSKDPATNSNLHSRDLPDSQHENNCFTSVERVLKSEEKRQHKNDKHDLWKEDHMEGNEENKERKIMENVPHDRKYKESDRLSPFCMKQHQADQDYSTLRRKRNVGSYFPMDANVSNSTVDSDCLNRYLWSDVSDRKNKDHKHKHKHKRTKKSREHSFYVNRKYEEQGDHTAIKYDQYHIDSFPISKSRNIENEKHSQWIEKGFNVYTAKRDSRTSKSKEMRSSRHWQDSRYYKPSGMDSPGSPKNSKKRYHKLQSKLRSSKESSSKTKHRRHHHTYEIEIKEHIMENDQTGEHTHKTKKSTEILTETSSKSETVTNLEEQTNTSSLSATVTMTTHLNAGGNRLETESCEDHNSSLLSSGFEVIDQITESDSWSPIMNQMYLEENTIAHMSNDKMENTEANNAPHASLDSVSLTGTEFANLKSAIELARLQNQGPGKRDICYEDFSDTSKASFRDDNTERSIFNGRVDDEKFLKILIQQDDSQEQCISTDGYTKNIKSKSESPSVTDTKHSFHALEKKEIFTKNASSRDVESGSRNGSNARERTASSIAKDKLQECKANNPNNAKANSSKTVSMRKSSSSSVLSPKKKGRTDQIKKRPKKDGEINPPFVDNPPWDFIKIDVNSVKYEELLPEHVMAALVDSPSKDNSNKQAERLYFKNDPRVQCYLGIFIKSRDKKIVKTKKRSSKLVLDIESKTRLNKQENTNSEMQSSVDGTTLIRIENTQRTPVSASSDSTTEDRKYITQKPRPPKACNLRLDKSMPRPMPKKDKPEYVARTYAETSHTQGFPFPTETLSEYVTQGIPVRGETLPEYISDDIYSNISPVVENEALIMDYPIEREDIYDPRWEKYQFSNSESDEFRFIRQMWQRNHEEKLTRNLTVQNYRHNRLQYEKTEWTCGKRKRKADQDLNFLFEQPPAKIAKRTKPSTFLQDKEIDENNAELHQILLQLKNTTMCALDYLQVEYEKNCSKLTDQLAESSKLCDSVSMREKLYQDKIVLDQNFADKVNTVIENFKKRHYKVCDSLKQEQEKILDIKKEIERYDRFCGSSAETRLTEEEMNEFILINDMIKSNRIFYGKH